MKKIRNMKEIGNMKNPKDLRVAYFAGTMLQDHDGVTRVIYKWIEYLTKKKIKNIFISPLIPPKKSWPTEMHKVPSIKFPLNKEYSLASPEVRYFKKRLDRFKPDIIHVNSPCPLGYAALTYAKKRKIPVIATYHTHFISYAKYYYLEILEPFLWLYTKGFYNNCNKVLVPSKSILSELRQHGLKRLEYLPHGVDTQAFNRSYRSIKWRKGYGIDNKIVLLYVGRLVWEKDLKVLADTYAKFESNRSLSFVIVGDGPIRQDLEKLMPKAIFTGKLIGKELSTAYASSDIFVFPSTTETFGNVILEAMISGLPCVAANKGGSKSAIKNNVTGLLAKPHDCKDFTKKVKYLIHHPKLRKQMAQHAVEYAEKQSWNLICERLFKEYYKLLNKNYTRR